MRIPISPPISDIRYEKPPSDTISISDIENLVGVLCSVLRVSSESDPSRRDRSVSVPAESAAETETLNHGRKCLPHMVIFHKECEAGLTNVASDYFLSSIAN